MPSMEYKIAAIVHTYVQMETCKNMKSILSINHANEAANGLKRY